MMSDQKKSIWKKARELPPFKKLLWFLGCVVIWFALLYLFTGRETDSLKAAKRTQTYWLLSTIVIVGASAVFYGTGKQEDKE